MFAFVEGFAHRLLHAAYLQDEVSLGEDLEFRALLAGHLAVGYHCTRLLDREVESIRARGLRLLDEALVSSRLRGAVLAGVLTVEEEAHLRSSNFITDARHRDRGRLGTVHLLLSQGSFHPDANGVYRLLTEWGGEVIAFYSEGTTYHQRLRSIGRPSVVVAGLDVSDEQEVVLVMAYPGRSGP